MFLILEKPLLTKLIGDFFYNFCLSVYFFRLISKTAGPILKGLELAIADEIESSLGYFYFRK